jgi:hypothetical protein
MRPKLAGSPGPPEQDAQPFLAGRGASSSVFSAASHSCHSGSSATGISPPSAHALGSPRGLIAESGHSTRPCRRSLQRRLIPHTSCIAGTRDELPHCRSGAWPGCSLVPLGRASRTPRGVPGRGAGFSSLRMCSVRNERPRVRYSSPCRCSCPGDPFSRETNPRAGPILPYGPCQGLARLVVNRHPIAPAGARFDALRLDEVLGSDRPYRKRRYGHPAGHLVACLVREDPFRL